MHKDAQGAGNINVEVSRRLFQEDIRLGEIVVTAREEKEKSATTMKNEFVLINMRAMKKKVLREFKRNNGVIQTETI